MAREGVGNNCGRGTFRAVLAIVLPILLLHLVIILRVVVEVPLCTFLCKSAVRWGDIGVVRGKSLKIGIEAAYPPFASKAPDGSIVGFDYDIGIGQNSSMSQGPRCE